MKITIESTARTIEIQNKSGGSVPARIWEGTTERGIKVVVAVTRIAVPEGQDQSQFQAELREMAAPTAEAVEAFPLRLLI